MVKLHGVPAMSTSIPMHDGRLLNDRHGVGGSIRSMALPKTQMMADGRFINNAQGVGGHMVNMTPRPPRCTHRVSSTHLPLIALNCNHQELVISQELIQHN